VDCRFGYAEPVFMVNGKRLDIPLKQRIKAEDWSFENGMEKA
jgi:hypothetical protein